LWLFFGHCAQDVRKISGKRPDSAPNPALIGGGWTGVDRADLGSLQCIRIQAIGCTTSPMGAHLHPAYGINPTLPLGHGQGGPRSTGSQRANPGPLARLRPVSSRPTLAAEIPEPELTGPVPPGSLPERHERSHSALRTSAGTKCHEYPQPTKNAPGETDASTTGLKALGRGANPQNSSSQSPMRSSQASDCSKLQP
jgi:hypothetical protein